MSEMIERVALAISGSNDPVNILSIHRTRARLAIEAMREPTEAMEAAGDACDEPSELGACADASTHWAAMIDAALKDGA